MVLGNAAQPLVDPTVMSMFKAYLSISMGNMNAKNAGLRVRLQPWVIDNQFNNWVQNGMAAGVIPPPTQGVGQEFIKAITQSSEVAQPQVNDVLNKALERIIVGQEQTMTMLKEVLTDRKS
tara:strand:- start:264 stop:626 length:363 start_codon:yes stop_codon:yes gene_type:complete